MRGQAERGWQDDLLEKVPSGIDVTQIEERLKLTPTERLERMRQFLASLEAARSGDGRGLPKAR